MQINYPNAIVPTPTVTYVYDPDYNRILSTQDGIGTATYTYNPITPTPTLGAGMVASVTGPLPNSVVDYQYDQLSRVISRSINGVAQAIAYDALGRRSSVTNLLGAFQYTYADATPRVASEIYPNGQKILYSYYNAPLDERLLQIQDLYPNGAQLSAFGYGYNPMGELTAWTNVSDSVPMRVWQPGYDAADQLTSVASSGGNSPVTSYSYSYDGAGNRLTAATNGVQVLSSYNALNELVSSGIQTNNLTYEWDAEDRLTAINSGNNREEFVYDGMGRRAEVIDMTNGILASNRFYLWCGTNICEVRDSTGANVTKRLFEQGEQIVGQTSANYYYTRDHLGSVREVLDSAGSLAARIDYDPYGKQTAREGSFAPEFLYAGYASDATSGLYFAIHRALDSGVGRWLNRDPHPNAELLPGGPNLYAYVANSPIWRVDAEGLCPTRNPWNPFDWPGIIGDWWYGLANATWDPATNTWTPAAPGTTH